MSSFNSIQSPEEGRTEEPVSLISSPRVVEFIESRDIRPEDIPLVEQATELPRQVFIENHNTASLQRERLEAYLQQRIKVLTGGDQQGAQGLDARQKLDLEYSQIMLGITQKYDWTAAWNLNSVMEKVAPELF
jgi:hypothetical protein